MHTRNIISYAHTQYYFLCTHAHKKLRNRVGFDEFRAKQGFSITYQFGNLYIYLVILIDIDRQQTNANTPSNTTRYCHITLRYIFHFARNVTRRILLQQFKKYKDILACKCYVSEISPNLGFLLKWLVLTNRTIACYNAHSFLNCCNKKCLVMVRAN